MTASYNLQISEYKKNPLLLLDDQIKHPLSVDEMRKQYNNIQLQQVFKSVYKAALFILQSQDTDCSPYHNQEADQKLREFGLVGTQHDCLMDIFKNGVSISQNLGLGLDVGKLVSLCIADLLSEADFLGETICPDYWASFP